MKHKTLRIDTVENGWIIDTSEYREGRQGSIWAARNRDELATIIKRLIEEPTETADEATSSEKND